MERVGNVIWQIVFGNWEKIVGAGWNDEAGVKSSKYKEDSHEIRTENANRLIVVLENWILVLHLFRWRNLL